MVELVDALDSKSSARKGVGVRFSPEPPFVKVFEPRSEIKIDVTRLIPKISMKNLSMLIVYSVVRNLVPLRRLDQKPHLRATPF